MRLPHRRNERRQHVCRTRTDLDAEETAEFGATAGAEAMLEGGVFDEGDAWDVIGGGGYEEPAAPAAAPPQQAPAVPAEPGYAAELEQLAQLKAQGILSEEEFEAKKRQILGI